MSVVLPELRHSDRPDRVEDSGMWRGLLCGDQARSANDAVDRERDVRVCSEVAFANCEMVSSVNPRSKVILPRDASVSVQIDGDLLAILGDFVLQRGVLLSALIENGFGFRWHGSGVGLLPRVLRFELKVDFVFTADRTLDVVFVGECEPPVGIGCTLTFPAL